MKIRYIIYVLLAILLPTACSKTEPKRLHLVRLDKMIAEYPNLPEAERQDIAERYRTHIGTFMWMTGFNAPELVRGIDSLAVSPAYEVFYPDVVSRLGSLDSIEISLGGMHEHMVEMFPDLDNRGYYAVISPFQQPIMISDTIVMIALNHYLGSDYPGYEEMDAYRRVVKNPRHIPYDVAEALLSIYRSYKPTDDATVATKMLYQGAMVNALLDIVGDDASLAEALGWTDEQLAFVEKNEADIWRHMVGSGLLQSTDKLDADKLLSPAPATTVVSADLPGRLGRYIGYKIVRSYLKNNPAASDSSLLDRTFYNDPRSLSRSGYNPL